MLRYTCKGFMKLLRRDYSIVLACVLLSSSVRAKGNQREATLGDWFGNPWQSSVIIDAGSTGSRIHIYQYKASKPGLAIVQQPVSSLKVTPGLSTYAGQPENVGESLLPLLEYAYKQVPVHQHILTEVHLFATAGFRVLAPRPAADLINSCRDLLAASRFKFRDEWASVMSGPSEGVFGWVAANYASGALQGYALRQSLRLRKHTEPSAPFVGVIELGGASAQVTFCPDVPTKAADNVQLLRLPSLQLPLYTHSFLGFGQEAALTLASTAAVSMRLQEFASSTDEEEEARDPCLPLGYSRTALTGTVVGSGDFEECRAIAKGLIAGQCQEDLCPIGDSMPVELQGPFIAMENFHYTAQFLGLPVQPTLDEIAVAGQRHCALAWPALQQAHGTNISADHLLHFCFSAAYIVALLHDGFKLGMHERRLRFTNYVEDPQGRSTDIDWTLGAVVVQTALAQASAADRRSFLQPYDHALHSANSSVFEHRLALLVLAGFVGALAVRLVRRSHWLRRMLRKHAGGTQALMLFEKCVEYFSDSGQSRSPRRTSKPG